MKKHAKTLAALLLALVLTAGLIPGAALAADPPADTVRVGTYYVGEAISPFEKLSNNSPIRELTQLPLVTLDRECQPVFNGIGGETRSFKGQDFTYHGPADVVITENEDGSAYCDFTLRDDLLFSDGTPLTVDDVIFTMYALADPAYIGYSPVSSLFIEGMDEYRAGWAILMNLLTEAGRDNSDFTYWTQADQTAFWRDLDQAGTKFAQEIVDYCIAVGYAENVTEAAEVWGFEVSDGATAHDFFIAMCENYDWDLYELSDIESVGSSLFDLMEEFDRWSKGVKTGESADTITGIIKTGANSMRVKLDYVLPGDLTRFSFYIAPLHWYGDRGKYDYENGSFGFTKGDLSGISAKKDSSLGAGPYRLVSRGEEEAVLTANESYYAEAPEIRNVQLIYCQDDDTMLSRIDNGTVDIAEPSFSYETMSFIKRVNGGTMDGESIVTLPYDNQALGYIGLNADVVSVGGDSGSQASKNLRKAFATIFAVYRRSSIDAYYGELANVIDYPVSASSWASPEQQDEDFREAFSTDVNGNPIYTAGMTDTQRQEAAKRAALGFLEAAGYTVTNGKVTAAPEGASLDYTFWIPADGVGDHPAFRIVTQSMMALSQIGITLNVYDMNSSSELWDNLRAQKVPFWAAAWGVNEDPDLYQIFFSGDETNCPGGSNYQYSVDDSRLNRLILEARSTTDYELRKEIYRECIDIIMDWGVEVPVYQRQNCVILSPQRISVSGGKPALSPYWSWARELPNIRLAGQRQKGDLDANGEVSNVDLVKLARQIVKLEVLNPVDMEYADMNSDGVVDNQDLVALARYLVGLK